MSTQEQRFNNAFDLDRFTDGSLIEVPVMKGGSTIFEIIACGPEPVIDLKCLPEGQVDGPPLRLFGSVLLNDYNKGPEELASGQIVVGGKLAIATSHELNEHQYMTLDGIIDGLRLIKR